MTTDDRIGLLASCGVDYAEAMDRFAGNEALYLRLAGKYLNDPHFEGMREAMENEDVQAAYQHAHSLKGVAGNLSFETLYRAACLITDALREGDLSRAAELLPEVERAHDAIASALEQLRG